MMLANRLQYNQSLHFLPGHSRCHDTDSCIDKPTPIFVLFPLTHFHSLLFSFPLRVIAVAFGIIYLSLKSHTRGKFQTTYCRHFQSHGNYSRSQENVLPFPFYGNSGEIFPFLQNIPFRRTYIYGSYPRLVVDVCAFVDEKATNADVAVV